MLSASSAFIEKMSETRGFQYSAVCTLKNSETLSFGVEEINTDGSAISDEVQGSALPVGNVFSKILTLSIKNEDNAYQGVDFLDAEIAMSLSLQVDNETEETLSLGTFTVAETYASPTTIDLTAYDHIYYLDQYYTGSYNVGSARIKAAQLATACCQQCGLTLGTATFLGYARDIVDPGTPLTCRQIIGYLAMLAGANACIRSGQLVFISYDPDLISSMLVYDGGYFDAETPYGNGDTLDGGLFWSSVEQYDFGTFDNGIDHVFSDPVSATIYTEDIIITGVSIAPNEAMDDESGYVGTAGSGEYVLSFVNPLIGNISQTWANEAAGIIAQAVVGLRVRPFELQLQAYPLAETLDTASVVDIHGKAYPTYITDVEFAFNGYTDIKCTAESAMFGTAIKAQSSEGVRMYRAARQFTQQSVYTLSGTTGRLIELMSNGFGLYATQVEKAYGSYEYYLHDKASLAQSTKIWRFTADNGFQLSTNGGSTWVAGFDNQGNLRANILSVFGLNAEWINAGKLSANYIQGGVLTLGGNNNVNGQMTVYNANGALQTEINNSKIRVYSTESSTSGVIQICSEYVDNNVTNKYAMNLRSASLNVLKTANVGDTYNNIIANTQMTAGRSIMFSINRGTVVNGTVRRIGYCETYDERGFLLFGYVEPVYSETGSAPTVHPLIGLQGELSSYYTWEPSHGSDSYPYPIQMFKNTYFWNNCIVGGNFKSYGMKTRVVVTDNYGSRAINAYETASPYFGDIGTGETDENGDCYVAIDDIFMETVATNVMYVVFLQAEGDGKIWVAEKHPDYFVVRGTPNLPFAWELKAKQKDYTYARTELEHEDNFIDLDYETAGNDLYEQYVNSKEEDNA